MQGSMAKVLGCLHELKSYFSSNVDREPSLNHGKRMWNLPEMESTDGSDNFLVDALRSAKLGPDKWRNSWDSKFRNVHNTALSGIVMDI